MKASPPITPAIRFQPARSGHCKPCTACPRASIRATPPAQTRTPAIKGKSPLSGPYGPVRPMRQESTAAPAPSKIQVRLARRSIILGVVPRKHPSGLRARPRVSPGPGFSPLSVSTVICAARSMSLSRKPIAARLVGSPTGFRRSKIAGPTADTPIELASRPSSSGAWRML